MKNIIGSLLLFFLITKTFSQAPEFGKISMEEIEMKNYPEDTAATAVILFDRGESDLDDELNVVYKRHTRIKFFTKASIDDWSSRTFYLDKTNESISKIKASTYNLEEGKIVESKMQETSIFKTRYDRYTDQVKFTLPNVKEGSVMEFSYTLRTSASLLPSWQFQHTLPAILSEYKVSIPNTFTFRKDLQGFLNISEQTSKHNGAEENWKIMNVPAFKEEPFTSNGDDYVSKINFYITEVYVPGRPLVKFNATWQDIANNMLDETDFGIQIKGSGFLKDIVAQTTAGLTEEDSKIKAIYEYVKTQVEWNKIVDRVPDHPFKKVLEEKKGSTSEINLLLVSMLQKAGLKAYPVLLSTRKHGIVRPFIAVRSQFNDAICMVKSGDKKILLDATDRGLPMNALPERCLNGEGLVISRDELEWIPLVSVRSRRTTNADIKISGEGAIAGKLIISRDGIEASDMRESYKNLGKEKYIKDFLSGKGWELTSSNFENLEAPSQSAKEIHEIAVSDHTQVAGDLIYLNPYVMGRMEENIFKSEQRLYPVDYSTPVDRIYIAKILLPESFVVEELPKQKIILLPNNGGKFVYSASQVGNTINFVSQFIINKNIFMPEEYAHLREFYSQVVAKQAEQIVLRKK